MESIWVYIQRKRECEKMKKYHISETFYHVKTRDRVGGTIRTDVFKENGLFKAYSFYWQDEDEAIVGLGESYNDEQAVMLSRKDLRKEWRAEQERILNTPALT
jgi:hypothetical protein